MIDPPGPPAPSAAPAVAVEPRQRWRLTFARDPVPTDEVGRAALDAWQACLVASGLPIAGLEAGGAGRPRIAFAAPLPANAAGEAELADLWLVERRPLWVVREALEERLPAAHRWIAAEDVWLGAPALAGRVVAADWRVVLGDVPADVPVGRLDAAARDLLAARTLPRVRVKGAAEKRYDLRPLLADLTIAAIGGAITVRVRTRFEPEIGSGRPEEVVAALGEGAGCPVTIATITRERLLLADDVGAPRRSSAASKRQ